MSEQREGASTEAGANAHERATLIQPDAQQRRDCEGLRVTPDQAPFVASVSTYLSLCDDPQSPWQPRAVLACGAVVGFVMQAVDPTDNSYWIGGLLIDATQQGRGYGRAAMEALVETAKTAGHTSVGLTYDPHNQRARGLYSSIGFVETGELDGDEVVARLEVL